MKLKEMNLGVGEEILGWIIIIVPWTLPIWFGLYHLFF